MVIYVYKSFKEPFKLFEGREMLQHPPSRNEDSMSENNLLDIASFSPKSLQPPSAWLGHIAFAAWIIREVSPKIFVELGTHSGNSYFAFCQSVAEAQLSTQCYAVDTWQGDEHASYYGADVFAKVSAHHQEHYAGFSHLLRMTFDDAVTHFADESIDLLHIDGLHTYEAVRHDFETWLPKLAPGAVVMFHDTNVRERNFGVWKWWEELQKQYPNNIEFSHSYGLGVLQLNNAPDGKQLRWLQSGLPDKQRLIKYFSALGLREELKNEIAERDKQIATLYSSTSWRITRPLRLAARQMRHVRRIVELTKPAITRPLRMAAHQMTRVRRIVELTKPAIARGGGLKRTLNKAILIYRCEGLEGIRRRIRIVATLQAIRPARRSGECDRNDYAEWIRRYDTLTNEARGVMRTRIDGFSRKPLISVVMPTYNSKPAWLIEAIESVRNQIYPHWELCIADDASTDKAIRPILEKYANDDARIKLVFRGQNGGISAASNSALELATGEWVVLLDHDDQLHPCALYRFNEAIEEEPDTDILYADEDHLDELGQRCRPFFKPDWSPALLWSQNYCGHPLCFRLELAKRVGGFREGYEGSQDHDLLLRLSIAARRTKHIAAVLYHWREHSQSTALLYTAKPHAHAAGVRAVEDHLRARYGDSLMRVDDGPSRFTYAPRFFLATSAFVSIIIPIRDKYELLRDCIASILSLSTWRQFEIVVIDNGSQEAETRQYLDTLVRDNGQVRVISMPTSFNWSVLNNTGVAHAKGDIFIFLNNDTEVITPDWIEQLSATASLPDVGLVGPLLLYPDNSIQHAGVVVGMNGWADHVFKGEATKHKHGPFVSPLVCRNVMSVTGACMAIHRSKFKRLGGFDETFIICGSDVELGIRAHGVALQNVYRADVVLRHYESKTRGHDIPASDFEQSMMKYAPYRTEKTDPFFNPNLSLMFTKPALKK